MPRLLRGFVRLDLDALAATALWCRANRENKPRVSAPRTDGIKLDDRDIKILSILQREGRIPKAALAARVNLSPTPCWERLRRLEAAGIIQSYQAQVSLKAFGPVTVVFVQIELDSHRQEDLARFEAYIGDVTEIVECWAVGGGLDYVCKMIVPHLEDYQNLIETMLARDIGIKRYYSYVVTNHVKCEPVPVEFLASRGV
jgi:Lrp/AsnC family transcriptional regulator of ectoine degradation